MGPGFRRDDENTSRLIGGCFTSICSLASPMVLCMSG